jgi:hypothetical protein
MCEFQGPDFGPQGHCVRIKNRELVILQGIIIPGEIKLRLCGHFYGLIGLDDIPLKDQLRNIGHKRIVKNLFGIVQNEIGPVHRHQRFPFYRISWEALAGWA